jgi:hypothetical protein
MAEKEIVVPLSELTKVEVCCLACGSGAMFAFSKDAIHTNEQRYDKGPAQSCPSCRAFFGSSLINALSKWHQLVSFSQDNADFCLKFHVPQQPGTPAH